MYRKILHLVALCFLTFGLLAQQKGVTPVVDSKDTITMGRTYAVIVGVSDYYDPLIPDLKYADKDASAFATWLMTQKRSDSPSSNIQVLVNDKATSAAVETELNKLVADCKKGDRVYLFFSGHSDIQRKFTDELGYFLCHNSNFSLYASGGTLPLNYLQVVVNTLETANRSEVILVMDACHSGKLSGSEIGGPHYVLENSEKLYPEATKFLSCRKLQYSLEGTQWGGGRGLFSFYFINGLKGLADNNHDGVVTALELDRYVVDNVASDAAPQEQSPQSFCKENNEVMATVIPAILDSLKRGNFDYPLAFNFAESKIVNNDYIFARDTSIKRTYEAFYESIAAKRLLTPTEDCAEYYYQKIIRNIRGKELHDEATRNFAVALQDDAQVIINELLNSKISRITLPGKDGMAEYGKLPTYLARAAALLGNKNKNYNNLKSNQCLFEAYLLQLNKRSFDSKAEKLKKRQLYHQSLQYQPKNPLAAMFLSNQFATDFDNLDSCTYYYNYAKALTPVWVIPRAYYAYMLNRYFDTLELAKTTIDEGLVLDSTNTTLINSLGAYYFYKKDYANARLTYEKALAFDSTDYLSYINLAATYQKVKDFEKAKFLYQKSISINSNQTNAYDGLGWMLYENGEYAEAATYYERGLQNNNQLIKLHYRVSLCYLDTKDWASVQSHVAQISKINPEDWRAPFLKACMSAIKGNDRAALQLLEEAMNKELDDDYVLENKDYFKNLKTNKKYLELMEE